MSPRKTQETDPTTAVAETATAVAEPPRTKTVRSNRELRCLLTNDERLAKADELAKAHQSVDAEEARQRQIKAGLKAELEAKQATRSSLANIVASGHEYRTVVVEELHDYVVGSVTTTRTDTGEQIDLRQMTDREKQMALPGVEPAGEETNDEDEDDNWNDDEDEDD